MRVAVSGINANDNPGPGVGIARSLKEADPRTEVVGISYDPNDSGHYLRSLFDRTVLMPLPGRGWSELKKKLATIQQTFPIDLWIPCLDAELPLYIQNQKEIEKMGIHLFLPSISQFEVRGKDHLHELAKKIGAKYPKTASVDSPEAMRKAIDKSFPFPFFLKGKYYKAYRVASHWEAQVRFDEIALEWGYPILLQQPVKGAELNLIGLGDGEGGLLGSVSIKKLTTTYIGKIWTAVTIRNEALTRTARQFAEYTKWRGPFELECIATPEEIHVIEINPRFPAWTYFATACGVNLPSALLSLVQGKKTVAMPEPAVGKLLVRYTEEIVADWAQLQRGTIGETTPYVSEPAKKQRKAG